MADAKYSIATAKDTPVTTRRGVTGDRVLVLDGEARSALAVVRSLSRLPLEIGVVAHHSTALAVRSRGASVYFPAPSAKRDRAGFTTRLAEVIEGWRPRVVLPLTDASLECLRQLPEELRRKTIIPCADPETLEGVVEKQGLLERAASLGLKVPQSLLISLDEIRSGLCGETADAIDRFSYPAVLKPNRSEPVTRLAPTAVSFNPVAYPASPSEVHQALTRYGEHGDSVLLQQRIIGSGYGVFCLCDRGEPLVTFCHRRILEKPPSGGPSVLSESIPPEEAPVAEAHRLLQALAWDGVAMVEFKQHTDGAFYLMEINARFWGSLQLAIDAGCDFPALLYRWAIARQEGGTVPAARSGYREGIRLRWTIGTVDHFLIRLRQAPIETLRSVIFANALHLCSWEHPTRGEVLRLSDPMPGVVEWLNWFREIAGA